MVAVNRSGTMRALALGSAVAIGFVACSPSDGESESPTTDAAAASTTDPLAAPDTEPAVTTTIASTTSTSETTTTTVQAAGDPEELTEPYEPRQARLVGRAAETNGINGIFVSPFDGNVYAPSVAGDEITVHDPDTGEILDRIGPERGVHVPDDVYITEDGTMYWTEIVTGNVGMLVPGGEPKHQFVGEGVNPITMSDDGRLFVARLFDGQGLYELDPNLESEPVLLNGDLAGLNSFEFGPDGDLYAPSTFTGEVLRIDVDADVPVGEIVASGFGSLSALTFNSSGEPHVASFPSGQVWKVDLAGDQHELLLDIDGVIDSISFGGDDRLYVAAGADDQIIRINDGEVEYLNDPGFGLLGGVAVSPDGSVWATEYFALRGFAPEAADWTSSSYVGASTVSLDGDTLILSSDFGNSVTILDAATFELVQSIGGLKSPTNAIRHGEIIVTSQRDLGNVVNAEDPSSIVLSDLGLPLGMASDGESLYVGDYELGDVWVVKDGVASIVASGLSSPEGLALDGDRLLVVETGIKQVTGIDLATGDTTVVVEGLDYSDRIPDGFPFGMFAGVAVGADRAIYVSDDGVNQVYEFARPDD